MRKQLVINIDDVGSSQSANAAMLEAFTRGGIATACSVMVPCAWFPDAVKLAKEHRIPMGVHLVISCEYPHYVFGPLTREAKLSRDPRGLAFDKSGYGFPKDYADIVFKEVCAQVECALDHGLTPTHLDSHMCTIPRWDGAFDGVCERLWERFRIPNRDIRAEAKAPAGARIPIKRLSAIGGVTVAENKAKLRKELEACVPGLNWFACHAAKMSPELQAMALDDKFAPTRDSDLQVLLAPEGREWMRELGIELVGVQDALAAAASA